MTMRTMVLSQRVATCLVSALLLAACHKEKSAELVSVRDAWVTATVPGQANAAGYLDIRSVTAARLVQSSTVAAGSVEVHNTETRNGIMHMEPVPELELPAGVWVKLAPGALHLMIMDLKEPLAPGGEVPLTLLVMSDDGIRTTLNLVAKVEGRGEKHP
jgi:periplasmic copper chaperone A